jgi:hypothetical protein
VRDDELAEFGLDGEERQEAASPAPGEIDYAELETRTLAAASARGLPDPSTVPMGTVVFNMEANELMVSDGKVWHSLAGQPAVPPPAAAKDATELLNTWRKMWSQAADYLDKIQKVQGDANLFKDLKRKP